jgi:hypothetical protein
MIRAPIERSDTHHQFELFDNSTCEDCISVPQSMAPRLRATAAIQPF